MTNYDEDFDSLFNSSSNNESGSSSLTAAEVERIATNTFLRGVQSLEQGVRVTQQLREDAMRQTEASHPGFLRRIYDPELCRKFIEEKPATARKILAAEAGQDTASLYEWYPIFDETARNYETAQPSNRESESAPEKGTASELSLQQINSLPLPERHQAIQALKNRVADISIDEADSENSRYKAERGDH